MGNMHSAAMPAMRSTERCRATSAGSSARPAHASTGRVTMSSAQITQLTSSQCRRPASASNAAQSSNKESAGVTPSESV
ncbi:MAG: hypothetical protein IPJ85_06165 [Flavobacteriales bacterium]|nr:hypothetical protein [Flavobacteriales bacterium]